MSAEDRTFEGNAAGADEAQTLRPARERVGQMRGALETPVAGTGETPTQRLAGERVGQIAGADQSQTLRLACERVREIRRALETPTARSLDETVPSLDTAIASLRAFCAAPQSGRKPEALDSALELQREVAKVQALFDSCGEFSAGWASVLWGLAGGYAADGSQTPRVTGRRVSLEG